MSVRDTIRDRVAKGDTRLLADIRKAANDAAAAGNYDEAAAMFQLESDAVEEAPSIGVEVGQAVEVDAGGDDLFILGTVVAVHTDARQVEVSHFEEVTAGGYTFPVGYVSTHPIDSVTVILPPEPVAEPAPTPAPALPPVDLTTVFPPPPLPKSAGSGVLVKAALAAQETHGGPVEFPDRRVTNNSASDRRRQQEERDARANR